MGQGQGTRIHTLPPASRTRNPNSLCPLWHVVELFYSLALHKDVAFFAVLAEVDALRFVGRRETEPDHRIDNLQYDNRRHDAEHPGNGNRYNLPF